MGASIPALRVLVTDFKHFTQRRQSDQSESQGSNFDFWDDPSRQSGRSLFKWGSFGGSKPAEPSTGTTSNISYKDSACMDLAPPAGLPAHLWKTDATKCSLTLNCETHSTAGSEVSGDLAPKTFISVPTPTLRAPSHNYPNLSQQLEDFLSSRKNSYAGTLNDSIYEGDTQPVIKAIARKDDRARDVKKRLMGRGITFKNASTSPSGDGCDRNMWSWGGVMEDGQSGKEHCSGGPERFVVIQTTEITVEFD